MATSGTRVERSSPVASGLALFAGVMMIVTGVFQVLQGIVALADDQWYLRTPNYTFDIDLTTWGWMHILVGIIIGLIGVGVVAGNLFARILAIVAVVIVMIDNFLFIPYYPFWSLLLIAFDAVILWALAVAPANE